MSRLEIRKGIEGPEFRNPSSHSKVTVKKGAWYDRRPVKVKCLDESGNLQEIKVNRNSLIKCINAELGQNKLKKSSCFKKGSNNGEIQRLFQQAFTVVKTNQSPKPVSSPKRALNPEPVDESDLGSPMEISNRGKNVGTLGANWKFNSDHIPLGGVITIGNQEIKIATFNVLNKAFLHHIKGGGQGLEESQIITEDQLGKREMQLKNTVISLLTSRDFLALQECSEDFENLIRKHLPPNFEIISSGRPGDVDRQLYIFNTNKLLLRKTALETTQLGTDKNKKMVRMIFDVKGENKPIICFVGVHLPGGPNSPKAREQLGKYLFHLSIRNSHVTIVALGDMNATTKNVEAGIAAGFKDTIFKNRFRNLTKGTPTHINTKKESVDYDSIHISAPKGVKYYENKPEALLPGLGKIAGLLVD